jgi:hypothetical protein
MPIASPYRTLGMGQRSRDDPFPLRAVGDPTIVFPPSDLAGISLKVLATNAVMDIELTTAQSGEVAFGLIGAPPSSLLNSIEWLTRFIG